MKKAKLKLGSMDFVLFSVILLLVAIGVVMVFDASTYNTGHGENPDYIFYLRKQLQWVVIGTIAMIGIQRIDYHKFKKYTAHIMIITTILLFAVFAFPAIKGAKRWISLGFASFQPSEIAKYAVVLFMAKSMEIKGERVKKFTEGILPYILVSGFYAGLILKEKNLSIASVVMFVTVIMMFCSGAKISQLLVLLPPLGLAGAYFIKSEPYRLLRFMSFLDPFKDKQTSGYQLVQSLLALGSGGLIGVGFGMSRQKVGYLPEPQTDFIFAVIGEELGLIGCVFLIALFLILIWRGIKISMKAKDVYGNLLAVGITSVIAIQAIINIAVVTGSMPVTGVPLPFISYGGSSLLFNMMAMGVLLNISRQADNNNKL